MRKKTPFKPAEAAFYATLTNIIVRYQAKGWADEPLMLDYFESFREVTLAHGLGEVMLGMDNHGPQITATSRGVMDLLDIVPALTPANCTDCISPVDRSIGAILKMKIYKKYDEAYHANHAYWNQPSEYGGLSDPERRMLVAQWASEAWADLCENHQHAIEHAFVSTGFLIAKDGSEDHLINLNDAKDPADKIPYSY